MSTHWLTAHGVRPVHFKQDPASFAPSSPTALFHYALNRTLLMQLSIISIRNKSVHPKAEIYDLCIDAMELLKLTRKEVGKSPLSNITLGQCKRYQKAVHQIHAFFMDLFKDRDING